MIDLLAAKTGKDPDIPIKYIGALPGEKLYEELMSHEEVSRTRELPTMFAILPALRGFYHKIEYSYKNMLPDTEDRRPYISNLEIPMTVEEIKAYLEEYRMLDEYIPSGPPHDLPFHRPGVLLEAEAEEAAKQIELQ
jgi:FlaA1/EpsC-like NDP-sugar epimerase